MQRKSRWIIVLAVLVLSACADDDSPREPVTKLDPPTAINRQTTILAPPSSATNFDDPKPRSIEASDNAIKVSPDPVYRPSDNRPAHNNAELKRQGINRVESRRLILYSDLNEEEIAELPALVDVLHQDWIDYFGELPPERSGADYQITGYLMQDKELFRRAGLLPEKLPYIEHGLHRGRRFWMREQPYPFYREHLLLHEATHCFMTALPNSTGPVWYMEGMAEYFGLHRRNETGELIFGAVPPPPGERLGFDRIEVIQDQIAAGDFMTLDDIARIRPSEFTETRPYAWSWAVCLFFNKHPRYQARFRELSAPASRSSFQEKLQETFAGDAEAIKVEWAVFAHEITHDYDFVRTAIDFHDSAELKDGSRSIAIAADRGWQATGIQLAAGRTYLIQAAGQVTLDSEPRPWISHPDGISFDYAHAAPIGQLQAAILVDDRSKQSDPAGGLLSPVNIGTKAALTPAASGQLYLRVNDHPNSLANNQGAYQVEIE